MKNTKKLGGFLNKIINPVIQNKGVIHSKTFLFWNDIAGEYKNLCEPIKIKFPNKKNGFGKLHLKINSAHAPIIHLKKNELIEKINLYFGFNVINYIVLHQDPNFSNQDEENKKNTENSSSKKIVNNSNYSKIDNKDLVNSLKSLEKCILKNN